MKTSTHNAAIAMANRAGQDAGDRSMRAAGRDRWNTDDLRVAANVCREILEQIKETRR